MKGSLENGSSCGDSGGGSREGRAEGAPDLEQVEPSQPQPRAGQLSPDALPHKFVLVKNRERSPRLLKELFALLSESKGAPLISKVTGHSSLL